MNIKQKITKLISSGTHSRMDGGKKVAIQITNFDAILTIITIVFYSIDSIMNKRYPLNVIHPLCLIPVVTGFFLVRNRYYDIGRYLIALNGWFIIFISVDSYKTFVGFEYFYFISIAIPFIAFALKEHWKGVVLSLLTGVILLAQLKIGTGLILEPQIASESERFTAMSIVILYMIAILTVARWQMDESRKEISRQQSELVHSSNLIALGEMSTGIAHEVNNPLQALSFQMSIIKNDIQEGEFQEIPKRMEAMDSIIHRISRMIKGLKQLSRDDSHDPMETVTIREVIEDVMNVSSDRLEKHGIDLRITGDQNMFLICHPVQFAQVIVNLINNSIDAIRTSEERWIRVDIESTKNSVVLHFTDSGKGIRPEIAHKIMNPFFTTKPAGKGTGLGLSISKSIIEKSGGKFFYDSQSRNTKFVIEYPV